MNKVQTDNSNLYHKIYLRKYFLPNHKNIKVLNCYSGRNIIWNSINNEIDNKIHITNIDKKQYNDTLKGDNIKYLACMDISKYNIIDLDAYGVPYKQLKYILNKKYKGIVYVTFIQSLLGVLPKSMLLELGFTQKMFLKCKTLLCQKGFDRFKQWLSLYGINDIHYIQVFRKYYLCLNIT